jgi:hypothetical protein
MPLLGNASLSSGISDPVVGIAWVSAKLKLQLIKNIMIAGIT